MLNLIKSGDVHVLAGPRQFHDEQTCWERTLESPNPTEVHPDELGQESPEWLSWYEARVDFGQAPRLAFPTPKFGLQQAKVMPRFRGMNKVQLATWLNTNGEPSIQASDMKRDELIALATRTWRERVK